MALDFLKGNVAKIEINLDCQIYQPMDLLQGQVTLQGERKKHSAGGTSSLW